jgi:hypothetical protein
LPSPGERGEMPGWENARDLGVPRLKCSRVALSLSSPQSSFLLPPGFPVQSLTR